MVKSDSTINFKQLNEGFEVLKRLMHMYNNAGNHCIVLPQTTETRSHTVARARAVHRNQGRTRSRRTS